MATNHPINVDKESMYLSTSLQFVSTADELTSSFPFLQTESDEPISLTTLKTALMSSECVEFPLKQRASKSS